MNRRLAFPWLWVWLCVWLCVASCLTASLSVARTAHAATDKPNILVIFGDDVGQTDVSACSMGLMGFHTPNIDRIAK